MKQITKLATILLAVSSCLSLPSAAAPKDCSSIKSKITASSNRLSAAEKSLMRQQSTIVKHQISSLNRTLASLSSQLFKCEGRTEPSEPSTPPSNPLSNPGFEEGISGWSGRSASLSTSIAHGGTIALKLSTSKPPGIRQSFSSNAKSFTVNAYAVSPRKNGLLLMIEWYNSKRQLVRLDLLKPNASPDGTTWVEFSAVTNRPLIATSGKFVAFLYKGQAFLDDVSLTGQNIASATPTPLPGTNPTATPSPPGSLFQGGLIIDHTAVSNFDKIPEAYLNYAKELTFQYAHRSDGSNVLSGLDYLEEHVDGVKYSQATGYLSLPSVESPQALRIYDGNGSDSYVYPSLYWQGSGLNITRSVVQSGTLNYSMWSWCDELTYYNSSQLNDYFTSMSQLESEFPQMRFIYMTGFVNGADTTVKNNNAAIRTYARDHNKILFDFADIENYDPAGNYYPNNTRENSWASSWCSAHPNDCKNLPSCSHTHGLTCVVEGKAFWYMMARLAGWNGQ